MLNSHHVFIFNMLPMHRSLIKSLAHCSACIQERECHKLLYFRIRISFLRKQKTVVNSSQEVAWCKLKPKLLFWDEVSKKELRRNIWLIQTHWQLVWYFYFGLWVQSIILFSLAVKILMSIDNSWLDYTTKISAVCQLTRAAALSPKENYLEIDWQHSTVPSHFLIKEIR